MYDIFFQFLTSQGIESHDFGVGSIMLYQLSYNSLSKVCKGPSPKLHFWPWNTSNTVKLTWSHTDSHSLRYSQTKTDKHTKYVCLIAAVLLFNMRLNFTDPSGWFVKTHTNTQHTNNTHTHTLHLSTEYTHIQTYNPTCTKECKVWITAMPSTP